MVEEPRSHERKTLHGKMEVFLYSFFLYSSSTSLPCA